jgi:hypothetical protein
MYKAEMELGTKRRLTRDPMNMTPLYPLLGLPNDMQEGYQDFIDQKVDKPKPKERRKIIAVADKQSRTGLGVTDLKSAKNVVLASGQNSTKNVTISEKPLSTSTRNQLSLLPKSNLKAHEESKVNPLFISEKPIFVCQTCNAVLELYKQRNRTIVFKSQAVSDRMKELQTKKVTDWHTDDLKFIIEMYKKAEVCKYSVTSEFDAAQKRDNLKRLYARQKSGESIMNPDRMTASQRIRVEHSLALRKQLASQTVLQQSPSKHDFARSIATDKSNAAPM